MFLGAITGSTSLLNPLEKFASASAAQEKNTSSLEAQHHFTRITQVSELNAALKKHQPVMLDFYADWCIACKQMEANVFVDPEVQKALAKFQVQWLQVDLTDATSASKAIMEKYHVIAPPTILFFNAQGKWLEDANVIGEQTREEFLDQIKQTFTPHQ